MESKLSTIYWFSQGQKKEHLRIQELQLKETSADTEQIKYNTNEIKTGSSKNTDLLKVEGTAESSRAIRFSKTSVGANHY